MEAREQALLEVRLEVDEHVATDEQVDVRQRRIVDEIVPAEDAEPPQVAPKPIHVPFAREVPADVALGQILQLFQPVERLPRRRERIGVDIRGVDLHVALQHLRRTLGE